VSTNSLPKLQIHLLGAPQIRCDGLACAQNMPAKAQAVLYYFAMTGRAHTRAALAGLLWSEHGEKEARRNLRKAVQELRRHLEPYLAIDYHTAGLRSPEVCWVDAVEFAVRATAPQPLHTEQLQAALALYRADFLEGFHVRDAPAFESWMLGERARLRELLLGRLATLASRHAAEGDLPQAIACMRRLLELEPWREEAHRQLMAWLAQSGQRNAALVQYDLCCRALVEELGVEPDAATRNLHTQLLQADAPFGASLHSAAASPVESPATIVDYTLVGRKEAWQALRTAWSKAVQAGAHMVAIGGEAGIGKTRLAEELLLYVQRQGHATARARAYALEGRLAYAPLADWLRTPPLQARLGKLDKVWLREVARLLPELLIEHPDLPAPEPLTERWQQKRLFEALRHAFTAETRPLLLLLDDLQWCDAETLAFLQYLVETAPQAPMLVVGTVRSDEVPEDHALHQLRRALLHAERLISIDLSFLSAEATAALAAEVREYALDSGAATRLYQATAGNPLFVVETVRAGDQFARPSTDAGLHTGAPAGPQSVVGLPPKVYAVIEARLAQLSPTARALAQMAATIGRAFTLPLLVAASGENEDVAVHGLDELWHRRIIRAQGDARYDFTHDRIRDVANAAGSPVKRAHFHRRVALALERLHAGDLDTLAGELGMHYQHAGAWAEALAYYRRAADVASRLYSHSEVAGYLEKAVTAVQMLPAKDEAARVAIELWLELGAVRSRMHDWGDESVAAAWQNAGELAERAGNVPHQCQALSYLAIIAGLRGQWSKAHALGEKILSLAREAGDMQLHDGFFAKYGVTLYHCGEFARALAAFRRHPHYSAVPVQLAEAWLADKLPSRIFLSAAQSLWLLGYPDQALAYGRALFAVRHQQVQFDHHCAGLVFAGILYTFLRDPSTVRQLGEELVAFCAQYESLANAAGGQMLSGWALAQQGDVEQGLLLVRQGVGDEFRRGVRDLEPHNRSLLAETLALAGEWEDALDEVTTALSFAEECGNCYWNSHLYKLQGDFLQALSASGTQVETYYQRAITVARNQGAKSLELRATTSLARLWQQQGKQAEAHEALRAIYGWFTEGFDTADLQEAKALLDQLS
jgi:DNA-binding SARP family transcriptional activator